MHSSHDIYIPLIRRFILQAVQFNSVIIDAIFDASEAFNKIIRPSGEKDSPARTCRELMKVNSDLPDGTFLFTHNKTYF